MPYVRTDDGCRIHYQVTGPASAPPVLFIQGLGADKHGWDMQRLRFSWSYRVIALDNRGAGRSDKPKGPYPLDRMARDAIAVLDDLGIEQAHVVGASMGGGISQFVAVQHPERVRSLTLVCTSCTVQPWRAELLRGWADKATANGMSSMAGEAARWVIGPRSFRRLLPVIGWLGPLGFGGSAEAFTAQVEGILAVEESLVDQLGDIDVPTLVVVGNQDILTPRGDSEDLAERIPTAELVVISGAAHGVMLEHFMAFNRVLGEFLGRAETAHQARTTTPAGRPATRARSAASRSASARRSRPRSAVGSA